MTPEWSTGAADQESDDGAGSWRTGIDLSREAANPYSEFYPSPHHPKGLLYVLDD